MLQINFQLLCAVWSFTSMQCVPQNPNLDQKQLYVDVAEISCRFVFRSTCWAFQCAGDGVQTHSFHYQFNPHNTQSCIISNTCFSCFYVGSNLDMILKPKSVHPFMAFSILLWCRNLCPLFFEGSSLNLMCGMFGKMQRWGSDG